MIAHKLQKTFDVMAVSLSMLCLLHCLALPLVILILPFLSASFIQSEVFHLWMLFLVVPTSIIAFLSSNKHQSRKSVIGLACTGLALMLAAVFFEGPLLGKYGETLLTTLGGSILAFAHIKNYLTCKKQHCCTL